MIGGPETPSSASSRSDGRQCDPLSRRTTRPWVPRRQVTLLHAVTYAPWSLAPLRAACQPTPDRDETAAKVLSKPAAPRQEPTFHRTALAC